MKYANKVGAAYTFVIGDSEIENNKVAIKRMSDGEIFEVELSNIGEIAKVVKAR